MLPLLKHFVKPMAGVDELWESEEKERSMEAEDLRQESETESIKEIKETDMECSENESKKGAGHSDFLQDNTGKENQQLEEFDAIINNKMQTLNEISKNILNVNKRLENAKFTRQNVVCHLALYRWVWKTFNRKLELYDVLAPSKHRTAMAGCVEELMKILCELDQIQSGGNEQIKNRRRAYVNKINNELLPKADDLLARSNRLLEISEKVTNLVKADMIEGNGNTYLKGKTKKMQSCETKRKSETKSSSRNSKRANLQPKYEVKQFRDHAKIRIQVPKYESPDSIKFNLENQGNTLRVSGQTFSLLFDVDRHNMKVEESTYNYLKNGILEISIPSRKQFLGFHDSTRPLRMPTWRW